jgi:hypothetical protein
MAGDFDPLGAKALARTVKQITQAAIDGAGAVLSRVCLPAAQEYGFALQDKVSAWRIKNYVSTMDKLKQKLAGLPEGVHAHPRLVRSIVEESSWIEDAAVQDWWSGLLSSSCTDTGDDDSNLLFINLLGNLTKLQARLLKYACENARKSVSPTGLIQAGHLAVSLEELCQIAQETDIQRLDRELDSLRGMSLLDGGIHPYGHPTVVLTPTALALHMYVRCSGSRASPMEFFQVSIPPAKATETDTPAPPA